MLFNMLSGSSLGMGVISGVFDGLTEPQVLSIPLTVTPLMVLFRTEWGACCELAVYYRPAAQEEFTPVLSGQGAVKCRLDSEYRTQLLAVLTGASAANTARVEYCILGVKR